MLFKSCTQIIHIVVYQIPSYRKLSPYKIHDSIKSSQNRCQTYHTSGHNHFVRDPIQTYATVATHTSIARLCAFHHSTNDSCDVDATISVPIFANKISVKMSSTMRRPTKTKRVTLGQSVCTHVRKLHAKTEQKERIIVFLEYDTLSSI